MKICISCQTAVEGKKAIRIKEDRIIRVIRAVKKAFGIAQMNELYVCEDDLKEHKKRRNSFEKSMLFASVLAGIVVIMVLGALLLSGRLDPWPVFSAFVIGVFVLALPLFKYAPALESGTPKMVYATNPKGRRKKR
jgi:cation transport ATPase